MESSIFSRKHININDFCSELINNVEYYGQYIEIKKYDYDWLENHCFGDIKEKNFLGFVKATIKNRTLTEALVDVVNYVKGEDITDEVFSLITNYPKNAVRKEIMVLLSHKELSEKQFLFLCEKDISFEVFFELAILYYNSPSYNLGALENFFENILSNSKFFYMKDDILSELINDCKASDINKKTYVLEQIDKGTE